MKTLLIASCGGFVLLAVSSVVTPICLPEISTALSISFSQGGGLETARTFVILAVFLLAGILAQRWSKQRFITLGHFILAAGLLMISFAHSYLLLIFSLVFMGIGGGFIEALLNPLIIDINSQDSGRYLNMTNAFYSIGVLLSAFVFGELLTAGFSWRALFRLASLSALLMGILFNVLHFPIIEKNKGTTWNLFRPILFSSGFWIFALAIFFGGGIEAAFIFWSRSYVEAYYGNLAREGSIAVMIFAGAMAGGRIVAGKLAKRIKLSFIMLGSAFLGIIISLILPYADCLSYYYFLLAFAGVATACFWPSILAEATAYLKMDSTILIILLSCTGIAGYGLTPWIIGIIGDAVSLKAGLFFIPMMFLCLIIALIIEAQKRTKQTSSDMIFG